MLTALDGSRMEAIRMGSSSSRFVECILAAVPLLRLGEAELWIVWRWWERMASGAPSPPCLRSFNHDAVKNGFVGINK
jgi:hypothetical protein